MRFARTSWVLVAYLLASGCGDDDKSEDRGAEDGGTPPGMNTGDTDEPERPSNRSDDDETAPVDDDAIRDDDPADDDGRTDDDGSGADDDDRTDDDGSPDDDAADDDGPGPTNQPSPEPEEDPEAVPIPQEPAPPSVVPEDDFPSELCGTDAPGTGDVAASLRVLTRTHGVSPETVYFSAQDSEDASCRDFSGGTDMEACRTGQYLGFHFTFDDPDSGVFATTGNSKNEQSSGSPRALHTFVCTTDNSRFNAEHNRCEYAVRVRVENPSGDYDDACVQVNIRPQSLAYAASDTYCISSDGDFEGCPEGIPNPNLLRDTPDVGEFSGKRILYQRGSSGTYSPICIDYAEKNVRVDSYGAGSLPVIEEVAVGVDRGCNDRVPNTRTAQGYPALAKDAAGNVAQGWAYDIAVTNLRVGSIETGMAVTLVTYHALDMDWSSDSSHSGRVTMANNGQYCGSNDDLDCNVVPYPYGVFASEIVTHASTERYPLLNFSCLVNCGLVNGGIIGSDAKTADEHNARFMGSWGLVVSNSWFRGDHIGGAGPKHKLTLRQVESGTRSSLEVDPEDFVAGNHDGDAPGWVRESDPARQFSPHFNFVVDSIFGDTERNPASDDGYYLSINSGSQYCGVFDAKFIAAASADDSVAQLGLGGRNIVVVGTEYADSVGCRFDNDHGGAAEYHDEDMIFTDAPSGQCDGDYEAPPFPDAPQ